MHKPPPNFTINRWYVYYSQSWVVPQLQEKIPAPGANSNMEPKVPVEQRLRNPPTVTYKTCHITIHNYSTKNKTKNMWMFSEQVWGLLYDGLLLNTNKVFFEVWWGLESSWLVECFVGESICCEVFVGRATRLNITLIRMSWFGMASPSLVVGRVDPNWQIHFFWLKNQIGCFFWIVPRKSHSMGHLFQNHFETNICPKWRAHPTAILQPLETWLSLTLPRVPPTQPPFGRQSLDNSGRRKHCRVLLGDRIVTPRPGCLFIGEIWQFLCAGEWRIVYKSIYSIYI